MSHFVVFVVGEVEDQLEPFNENKQVEFVDRSEEILEEWNSTEKKHNNLTHKEFYHSFDSFVENWYGYKKVDGVYGYWTNPKAKWDWYEVGGRWSNNLPLKDGTKANSAIKSDIDIEGCRKQNGEEAAKQYDKVMEIVGDSINSFVRFKDIDIEDIEEKRNVYWEQETHKKIQEYNQNNPENRLWIEMEQYAVPREQFIQEDIDSTLVPHALLWNGEWYERGEMGWFGMASNEMELTEWNKAYFDIFNTIPDNERITIVDCHI